VVVTTASEFRTAVRVYRFDSFSLDADAIDAARATVDEAGLIVVGEPHGMYETPAVVYSLAVSLGTRALAFEWSHEEMDEPVQDFVRSGSFDFERLWRLPSSAEFFCGDGRITTGHFALLQRLSAEGRLEQVIAFDRLDPVPHPEDWRIRDREMAERLLAEWQPSAPLMVVTGAFHAAMQPHLEAEGATTTALMARERSGLVSAVLQYDNSAPMPSAPITFRLPEGTPACVPGLQSTGTTRT
jgi:hypothetical protein